MQNDFHHDDLNKLEIEAIHFGRVFRVRHAGSAESTVSAHEAEKLCRMIANLAYYIRNTRDLMKP